MFHSIHVVAVDSNKARKLVHLRPDGLEELRRKKLPNLLLQKPNIALNVPDNRGPFQLQAADFQIARYHVVFGSWHEIGPVCQIFGLRFPSYEDGFEQELRRKTLLTKPEG